MKSHEPYLLQDQAVKLSADPRNSAFFRGFLVILEISANLVRYLKGCMGWSNSGTTWPTEMGHLSKFTEFHKEMHESLFCVMFSCEIVKNLGKV